MDETLRALLRHNGNLTTDIEVAFDAPTKDWASRRNTPTLDLYLYDIRENLDRRRALYDEVEDNQGRVIMRLSPPRWFRLSYLVTAWTQRSEDEHRLLSTILFLFINTPYFPRDVLQGGLVDIPYNISIDVARPPSQERAVSDIWSALGGELKPSLDLVLTTPFIPNFTYPMGPPVVEAPSVRIAGPDGKLELPPTRRNRDIVAALAEEAGPDIGRKVGARRGQFAALGSDAWVDPDALGPDGETATSQKLEIKGGKVKAVTTGDGDDDGEERPPSSEEAMGGNERMPGRRFRFSVIEPGKKPK